MKKRLLSILLCVCMALTLLPTAALAADEVSVSVNGTALVSGKSYVADGQNIIKEKADETTNFFTYTEESESQSATLTVVGSVALESAAENTALLSISNGTLTLAGGNLSLITSGGNSPAVNVAGSLVTAEGYAGNLSITAAATDIGALAGLGTINLTTTGALNIGTASTLTCNDLTLSGDTVDIGYVGEGARINPLLGSGATSVTATGTKGLSLIADGEAPICSGASVTLSAPNGGITLQNRSNYAVAVTTFNATAKNEIHITGGGSPAINSSSTTLTSKEGSINVENDTGMAVSNSGSFTATTEGTSGDITIVGNSSYPAIVGSSATLTSTGGSIKVENQKGMAVSGPLIATAKGDITVVGNSGAPAIIGAAILNSTGGGISLTNPSGSVADSTLQAHAHGDIFVSGGGNGSTTIGSAPAAEDGSPALVSDTGSITVQNTGAGMAVSGALIAAAMSSITVSAKTSTAPVIGDAAALKAPKVTVIGASRASNQAPLVNGVITALPTSQVLLIGGGSPVTVTGTDSANVLTADVYGGDVTEKGLEIADETASTYYKAGSGYALWDGATEVLTLNNADINNHSSDSVIDTNITKIVLVGNNTLTANGSDAEGIKSNTDLTIGGDGSLSITATLGSGIRTSGSLKVQDGASITVNQISAEDDLTLTTTGAMNVSRIMTLGTLTNTSQVSFSNAIVSSAAGSAVYGAAVVPGFSVQSPLTIPAGASLTIPEGSQLFVMPENSDGGRKTVINNSGTLTNNGLILVGSGDSESIAGYKIAGSGFVGVMETPVNIAFFKNDGTPLNSVPASALSYNDKESTYDLKLTDTQVEAADNKGYTWLKDEPSGVWTFTLTADALNAHIYFPENINVVIKTDHSSIIWRDAYLYGGSLTFTGSGKLWLQNVKWNREEDASDHQQSVTVAQGANVLLPGGLALSNDSLKISGTASTVRVDGKLSIQGYGESGDIACGQLTVGKTGAVTLSGYDGAFLTGNGSLTGAFTLEDGGVFNSDCYLYNLAVCDEKSTFTQDELSQYIVLPKGALPAGYALKTVDDSSNVTRGTVAKTDAKLWIFLSAYPAGATGNLTLKAPDPVSSSGGGSSSGGATAPSAGTTTTNPDGSTTVTNTTTKSDGTKETVATTTKTDGAKEAVTSTEKKQSDGSTVKTETVVKTDAKGNTTSASGTVTTDSKTGAVTVPAAVLETLAKTESSTLTVETPNATLVLDNAALKALVSADGKPSALTITPVPFEKLPQQAQKNLEGAAVFSFSINGGGVDFGSGTVTVTLNYTRKAANTVVVVYYVDNNGNMTRMPGARYQNGKATYKTNHFSLYAVTEEAMPFTDVSVDAYYADAVLWAVDKGVTSGTSASTFAPNATCTRAQTVAFLWRAMGSPEPTSTKNPFTDVKSDAYYYKAVLWAVEKGVTSGTSATTFNPGGICTRAQVMTFLWRAEGSPVVNYAMNFTDVAADAYYAEAVRWAVSEGITSGTSATAFAPAGNCSRAQIVTFLYRGLGE